MAPTGSETQITQTQVSDEETTRLTLRLVFSSTLPMVLKAVIELGVLEIMAKAGPGAHLSPSEVAAQFTCCSNPDAPFMLESIFKLLASHSILTHVLRTLPSGKVESRYGLGRVGKRLVDGPSIDTLFCLNHDTVVMESWEHLKDAILEGGIPFDKAHGMSFPEYLRKNPRFQNIFNKGMSDYSTITMEKILDKYKGFEGLETVVDVGGGTGADLSMIVSKYPSIKGTNFDLPHVIEDAPSYSGVVHVEGDMFIRVPKADAVFMKWICHALSDEDCAKLLKNCYNALPENGKVIVAECILPVAPDPSLATVGVFNIDCIMLAHPGGKERTEKEFEALAKGVGFEGFRTMCCAFDTSVMEFLKSA